MVPSLQITGYHTESPPTDMKVFSVRKKNSTSRFVWGAASFSVLYVENRVIGAPLDPKGNQLSTIRLVSHLLLALTWNPVVYRIVPWV